jgi:hypothetical protein
MGMDAALQRANIREVGPLPDTVAAGQRRKVEAEADRTVGVGADCTAMAELQRTGMVALVPLTDVVGPHSGPVPDLPTLNNNNNIYLVRPPRGGWLHRGSRLRVACIPVVPLGCVTPCSVTPSLIT